MNTFVHTSKKQRARLAVPASVLLALALLLGAAGGAGDTLRVGNFSSGNVENGLPAGWERLTFKDTDNQTRYTLVRDAGTIVVKAVSDGGASGLIRRQRIDPAQYPVLEWRWKVDGVLKKGDARKKSGDDYPARLYITFDYDKDDLSFVDKMKVRGMKALGYDDIPLRALNYLWASNVPEGEVLPNPYTDWVMMIPVKSGSAQAGAWHMERRNVLEDYRAAFGEDPPMISGVALMTDTDDTGESATAYYGDIVFKQ